MLALLTKTFIQLFYFDTKSDFTQCSSLVATPERSNIHWSWQFPFLFSSNMATAAGTHPFYYMHKSDDNFRCSDDRSLCVCARARTCAFCEGHLRAQHSTTHSRVTARSKGGRVIVKPCISFAREANRHAKTGMSWKLLWAFEREIVRVWGEQQGKKRQERSQWGSRSLNSFRLT